MSSPAPLRSSTRARFLPVPRLPRLARPVGALAAVAVLTLGLAGCGSDDNDTPPPAPTGCATDTTAGDAGAALLPVPPAKVTLLTAGSEPQQAALSAFDRATAQPATLVTTSTFASPDGESATQSATTVDLPITARVNCTDPTDIDMQIGAASSPDTALNEALKAQNGSRAGMSIGPGVAPISLRILPGENADDNARQAVEEALVSTFQRSVTLPTEPIGVGATWEAVRTVNAGANVRQTINATLTAQDGDQLTVEFTIDETPINSVFRLPDGGTLTIDSYSMTGNGTVVIDLTRGVPVSGQMKISGGRTLVGGDNTQFQQLLGFESNWSQ
ncbi:hypothetical protein [Nocardia sp. 348MFTsu5.1]|uniref:hypothetical protein n=1 Tax=Nocardia sp. 348MFTsu5.1 TaxID=1172185 RepID=UPI00036744A8|nr:hypothetical protein [Nocardia sp. 348MFTsu5.1]